MIASSFKWATPIFGLALAILTPTGVQADNIVSQLSSNVADLTDDLDFVSQKKSPIIQTGLFGSHSSCNSCGSDQCCGDSCCEVADCGCPEDCCSDSCCPTECGVGCGSACGCESGCCGSSLLSCLQSTPCGWGEFISPMTNPVFFEDPRTLSEVRFIYLNHKTPGSLGSDTVQLFAAQVRAALTDRLSIIATKDGFITSNSPLVEDGWADISAGLKYNLIADRCNQHIVSVGATYELPVGTPRALQGNGDGEFNIFLSAGKEIAEDWHFVTASGFRLPVDTDAESGSWYWSSHLDHQFAKNWYLLGEVNWYHWMNAGNGGINGVEGGDLFNLGSTGVNGNDIVTGAIGAKYKPTENQEIGVAWEIPLTERKDIIADRLTVDWIIRF